MFSCELDIKIDIPFRRFVNEQWLGRIVEQTLSKKGLDSPVELSLVITDAKTVRKLNKKYRGRDEATDVLSFALREENPSSATTPGFVTPPDGVLHLGEVIVSYPQAAIQAQEQHHPLERELALLVIHGILHLLGHEHQEPEAELRMRTEEERILAELSANNLLRATIH
jgi:probable rRNA maturation factor